MWTEEIVMYCIVLYCMSQHMLQMEETHKNYQSAKLLPSVLLTTNYTRMFHEHKTHTLL